MQKEFWQSVTRYGLIHEARCDDKCSTTPPLLVFVHGLFGDARATWGSMPEWVIDKAGFDVDSVSFSYPSKLWQRCGIERASVDLKTWLETEFAGFRHILFVTHSTGGLIVKHLLADDFASLQQARRSGEFDLCTSNSTWLRTRRVIHIAVPHRGGSPLAGGLGILSYRLIFPCIAPFLWFVRFLTQGGKDWGWNAIIPALRWKNPRLTRLEQMFEHARRQSKAMSLPTPSVHDIGAGADLSVSVPKRAAAGQIRLRGTHRDVKIPRRAGAPIVGIVADFIRGYPRDIAATLAERTLCRIHEVNKASGIEALIGAQSAAPGGARDACASNTLRIGSSGSQSEICERVLASIRTPVDHPKQIVVTGAGGVGKSAVLRMIAWRLCRDYLEQPKSAPLAFFVPLYQITDSETGERPYSWERLWTWWLQWAQSLYPGHVGTPEWLHDKFLNAPVAVIFDGLDDFLLNHPALGLSAVVATLRAAGRRYAANSRLAFVLAVRSDIHGFERLVDDPRDIHRILSLTRQQALQTFPACRSWLPSVRNPELLEHLLTPLILSHYRPPGGGRLLPEALSEARLMHQIIATILRRSNLVGRIAADGMVIEAHHLLAALTVIAWLFFSRSRGEIHAALLCEEAAAARKRRREYFRENPPPAACEEIVSGFALVGNPALCHAILQRTVFITSGPDMHRFTHRNWRDFLLARFFIDCLRCNYFADFGDAKLYSGIYRMAGELYEGPALTAAQIGALLAAWRESGGPYVISNFIGFLGWTRTPVEARAIELLLDELPRLDILSRGILIGAFGYRISLNDERDRSLGDLRRAFFPKLTEFSNPATIPVDDPVACSLAWCYHKLFAGSSEIPPPAVPWPALGFGDEETLKVVPVISTPGASRPILDERAVLLQQALLAPILDTYTHPGFVIRAVHYLYHLTAARKHDVASFEVSRELAAVVARGGEFEKLVESFTPVPELFRLYQNCQAAHRQLEAVCESSSANSRQAFIPWIRRET